jgi:hypothetical protein
LSRRLHLEQDWSSRRKLDSPKRNLGDDLAWGLLSNQVLS